MESLRFQPHPHTQKRMQSVGGSKTYRVNTYFKNTNSWQMNGLKKKSILQQTTQPFPPGTLRSKVVAWPLNVLRPLLWRELLWFDSCEEPPPASNQLILSFWLLSYVKFDWSTSKLISHIKTGSACFKHFSSHTSCKTNLYSEIH